MRHDDADNGCGGRYVAAGRHQRSRSVQKLPCRPLHTRLCIKTVVLDLNKAADQRLVIDDVYTVPAVNHRARPVRDPVAAFASTPVRLECASEFPPAFLIALRID